MAEADPTPPPAKDGRARLWAIVGTLAFLLLGLAAYFYLREKPPPADADFQASLPAVPDADNGLAQLQRMDPHPFDFWNFVTRHKMGYDVANKLYYGAAGNDTLADDFIQQAQPGFEELDRILPLPVFSPKPYTVPVKFLASEVQVLLTIGQAGAFTARQHLREGDYAAAGTDALRLRRLARRMTEGTVSITDILVVTIADKSAASTSAQLLNDPALPASELARLEAGWGDIRWNAAMSRSLNEEYQHAVLAIESFKESPATMPYFGKRPNVAEQYWMQITLKEGTVRQDILDYFRLLRQALGGNYAGTNWAALERPATYSGAKSNWTSYLSLDFGSQVMSQLFTSNLSEFIKDVFHTVAIDRLVTTGLAARHYYNDHHALPAKLDDLVPQYLSAVPLDPYDGKPLRYDVAHGLIYSIGTSLKDLGGSKITSTGNELEPVQLFSQTQPTLSLTFQNPAAPLSPSSGSGNAPAQ